jgi:hypothetical protein
VISADVESALERAQPFQTKWFTTTMTLSLPGVTNVTQGETIGRYGGLARETFTDRANIGRQNRCSAGTGNGKLCRLAKDALVANG